MPGRLGYLMLTKCLFTCLLLRMTSLMFRLEMKNLRRQFVRSYAWLKDFFWRANLEGQPRTCSSLVKRALTKALVCLLKSRLFKKYFYFI